MFNFIFKNALTKKSKILLTIITIIVACMVGLLSINVSQQVDDGIIELSDGYDVVIGPTGSDTQLAFNALFFSEDALGTIDYSYYEKLKNDDRIGTVIPFAMADNYGNFKIVGTESVFLQNYSIKGSNFKNAFECVIGYNVAQSSNLSVGDEILSTHGLMGSQHANPIKITGILNKTNTNYDNVVFTKIDTIWESHGHSAHADTNISISEHEDHEHSELGITSLLLRTKSLKNQSEIVSEYSKIHGVQAITPTIVLRKSLESIDMSKQIVYALTTIIFCMSVILLFIISLLTAQDLRKDIKLMRYLGISQTKISLSFMLQSAFISLFSVSFAFLLSHVLLNYVNNISTGYGIVINPMKFYTNEYIVLGIMFFITLLPTFMYIIKFFKKDITKI